METLKKQAVLPRWRGFNLLDMFHAKSNGDFNGHKLDRELLKFLREF